MNCLEVTESLGDYVEWELPLSLRSSLNRHLGGCRECRAYLGNYEATIRLSRDALRCENSSFEAEMPEYLVADIVRRSTVET